MQSLIFVVLLVAPVFANPHYEQKYAAVPVVHNKVVGYSHHTPMHTVQKVHHTVHPISIPQHHPPVTTVHHEPTAVLAKAPKISGFAFKSEVRHDAHLKSYGHGYGGDHGSYGHGGGDLGHGYGGDLGGHATHGHAIIAHGPSHGYGGHDDGHYGGGYGHGSSHGYHHEPAPYVSSAHLSVAPAKIVETPSVSSYKLETGRIDTATKEHYATAHIPVTHKVGYKTIAVHESHGHGGHYGGHGSQLGYGSHY